MKIFRSVLLAVALASSQALAETRTVTLSVSRMT